MIHLDTRNGEKDKILTLINSTIDKPNFELECLFYVKPSAEQMRNPSIPHTKFMSIVKRYKGNPNFISKVNERLTISFPRENVKYSNVRILIKGSGAIKSYCNNENLSLIRNNINFEYKINPKGLNRVEIINYNFRFNLKEELNFNNDEAKINELLRDINNIPKNYRYKKIFSFEKKTKDFQIDASIVKSSLTIDKFLTVKEIIDTHKLRDVEKPKNVSMSFHTWWDSIKNKPNEMVKLTNSSNYFKNIKDSNVFTNLPTYEVEVEYIKNKSIIPKFKNITDRKDYVNIEFINFFKEIGCVLQCIQGTFYIISNDDQINIKQQYIKVIENSINEKMLEGYGYGSNIHSQGKDGKGGKGGKGGQVGKDGKPFVNYKAKGGKYAMNTDNDINFEEEIEDKNAMSGGGVKIIGGGDEVEESEVKNGGGGGGGGDSEHKLVGGKFSDDSCDNTDNNTDDDSGDNTDDNTDDKSVEHNDSDEFAQTGGAKKLAELKNKIHKQLQYKMFFGPMIIDLLHNDASHIDKSAIPDPISNTNININYLVTDKTDGERNLLFFDETGKAYGIDRENTIKYFGIIIPSLANTILDGEYINRSYEDRILNNFYIFDAYIFKGENIMIKPFLFSKKGGKHGRYDTILESVKAFNESSNITQLNSRLPFLLYKKEYYQGDTHSSYKTRMKKDNSKSLMTENCESILTKMNVKYGGFLEVGHLFTYKTDGLVFHPDQLSVFQKSMDDHVVNPFQGGRWNNNYKWKSQANLTIDFRIIIVKEIGSSRPAYKYFGDKKYVLVNLMTGIYHNNNKIQKTNSIDNNKLNFYLINSGIKIQNLGSEIKFFATNPFIGYYDSEGNEKNNMGEAYFEVDGNDNIMCKDGSFITDGIICECSYDLSSDEEFRWTPERLRADKQSPNAYVTANTTWLLINKPITKEYLAGKEYVMINGKMKKIDKYGMLVGRSGSSYSGSNSLDADEKDLITNEYYSTNQKVELLTNPLKKFNNFVKEYLIERALSNYTKPNVMDLAVGEFGDMHKYAKMGVGYFLGLDINEHNINNPKSGAATRLMDQINKNPASQYSKMADKTLLIVGTATKNIANGDCAFDNINKYYLDVLYGRSKGNTSKLRKLEGVGLDGFDVITCMYAIHYMMNNETALDNFLRNVSENLLDQGYFIGTCLDGMEIIKELGGENEINGDIDGKSVFFIRKESTDPDAYKNITVGNKITVFFETFAGSFSENLVNKSYLKEKAKTHNLKMVEFKPFLEEPGNMLSKYEADGDKMSRENVKKIRESNAMMMWARFNSYFIFQKVRSKD
jgi:hypothetical protein